jgi:hypothetical protein
MEMSHNHRRPLAHRTAHASQPHQPRLPARTFSQPRADPAAVPASGCWRRRPTRRFRCSSACASCASCRATWTSFFEIRVSGIKEQIRIGSRKSGEDGIAPAELLERVSDEVHEIIFEQYQLLNADILPALEKEGVVFLRRSLWSEAQRVWIHDYFMREVMPVLTPIGLDPAHPFPRVLNKSLNFAVELEGRDAFGRDSGAAIVQAPRALPRVIRLPRETVRAGVQLRVPVLGAALARRRAVQRHERARLLPVPRHAQLRPVRR